MPGRTFFAFPVPPESYIPHRPGIRPKCLTAHSQIRQILLHPVGEPTNNPPNPWSNQQWYPENAHFVWEPVVLVVQHHSKAQVTKHVLTQTPWVIAGSG